MPALAVALGCALLALLAAPGLAPTARAQNAGAQPAVLQSGDFEGGTAGWTASAGAVVMLEAGGGIAGTDAARLASGLDASPKLLGTWVEATAGAEYRVTASALLDDPGVVGWQVILEFRLQDGTGVSSVSGLRAAHPGAGYDTASVSAVAPAGTRWVRAVVEGSVHQPTASFLVDGVRLDLVAAAPEVTPTVQPPPPTPTASVPAPKPTAPPSATPVRTSTPTRTPSPTPLPITSYLRNATFEAGVEGWHASRGRVEKSTAAGGIGGALLLRADGGSTAWVEQAVTVIPGAWYEAAGLLAPVEGVRAAWVRIAWYASSDGSGAQMRTDDSGVIGVDGAAITVSGGTLVSTGPVQAPSDAWSAKVRVLLQPAGATGGSLAIGHLAFEQTTPPSPATPEPPPAQPTPLLATPTPGSSSAAPSGPSSTGRTVASGPSVTEAGLASQRWLRLTEAMPDPARPGRDADYEWVEITNLGTEVARLDGMRLRDRQRSTPLPETDVAPGASLVIAAALAEVDADVRLSEPIGNGLGNEGDRLELVDAAGEVVDWLEYGAAVGLPVRPGESVHRWFDGLGVLLGSAVSPPSPGLHAPAEAPPARTTSSAIEADDEAEEEAQALALAPRPRADDPLAWMLLLALGGGALGGALMHRLNRPRGARVEPAREEAQKAGDPEAAAEDVGGAVAPDDHGA